MVGCRTSLALVSRRKSWCHGTASTAVPGHHPPAHNTHAPSLSTHIRTHTQPVAPPLDGAHGRVRAHHAPAGLPPGCAAPCRRPPAHAAAWRPWSGRSPAGRASGAARAAAAGRRRGLRVGGGAGGGFRGRQMGGEGQEDRAEQSSMGGHRLGPTGLTQACEHDTPVRGPHSIPARGLRTMLPNPAPCTLTSWALLACAPAAACDSACSPASERRSLSQAACRRPASSSYCWAAPSAAARASVSSWLASCEAGTGFTAGAQQGCSKGSGRPRSQQFLAPPPPSVPPPSPAHPARPPSQPPK